MEVVPPLLVRDDVMFGTAQLPKFAEDQFSPVRLADEQQQLAQLEAEYKAAKVKPDSFELEDKLTPLNFPIRKDRLWLIPTAEVPLTNLVRESIVDEAALPLRAAVLPRRSGRGGQGHPRHDPPASVRQGRARLHHHL